jgi:hypothetical protein
VFPPAHLPSCCRLRFAKPATALAKHPEVCDFGVRVLRCASFHKKQKRRIFVAVITFESHRLSNVILQVALRDTCNNRARPLTTKHKVNTLPEVTLSEQVYNEIGQVHRKNLQKSGTTQYQSVDYRYNIRGWLTSISANSPPPAISPTPAISLNTFTQTLGYSADGNIATQGWKQGYNTTTSYAYAYTYDKLKRLTNAASTRFVSAGAGLEPIEVANEYNEALTYDAAGNILTLKRNAPAGTNAFALIDDLAYTYNGNQNTKIADATTNNAGFKDGTNTDSDYTYDSNGNMTQDKNKDITSITYNHLNLPFIITFTNNRTITFVYDATGKKLMQRIATNAVTDNTATRQYINGIEYNGANSMQHIATAEGRWLPSSGGAGGGYEFSLKDHLGNTRLTLSDTDGNGILAAAEVTQSNMYYAFGLEFAAGGDYTDRKEV